MLPVTTKANNNTNKMFFGQFPGTKGKTVNGKTTNCHQVHHNFRFKA